MKRLLISVAVLGLLASASAYADNDRHHGQGQGQGQGQGPAQGGGGGGSAGGGGGGGSAGGGGGGNPQHDVVPGSNGIFNQAAGRTGSGGQGNTGQSGSGGQGHWQGSGDRHRNSGNWQGGQGNANNWQGGNWQGNANNNWRGNNNWRSNNRWRGNVWHGNNGLTITGRNWNAPRRFHFGSYRRPHGWYYRRWSFGDFLPAGFFASPYWLTNYLMFGLQPPPPGFVWVRYGDDALLVDRYTGEVVQVVYGVFY